MSIVKTNVIMTIAGLNVRFAIVNRGTITYLKKFGHLKDLVETESFNAAFSVPETDQKALYKETRRLGGMISYAEYSLLLESIANPMLRHSRFFFHGAAFLWQGKVYIFTGKSGVGKTTMLRNWKELYPEETEIINGDKPVIEQRGNDLIVHPSPWTGKEGWNGNRSGKLAGIILLEQGKENRISRMEKPETVFPMFLQFLYKPTDEESVDLVCGYEEAILEQIPVWRFLNDGTHEAAEMLHNALKGEDDQ